MLLVEALLGALRLLRPISDFVRQKFAFTLVYLLTFAPLLWVLLAILVLGERRLTGQGDRP